MIRSVAKVTALAVAPGAALGYYYRPRPSYDEESHPLHPATDIYSELNVVQQALVTVARQATLVFTCSILRIVGTLGEKFEIIGVEKLHDAIKHREKGRGLITISNHVTIFDDPWIMAMITTPLMWATPGHIRWAICTEEMGFQVPAIATYFGLGQAFPVLRGGSINQTAVEKLQAKVLSGEWVHVFPEARCWQEGVTPLRNEEGQWESPSGRKALAFAKLAPFKWGVAKLIANAETTPIVLPFFHLGMQDVSPHDSNNNLISPFPKFGHEITVKFGDHIDVRDLIEDYHAKARARAETRRLRPRAPSSGSAHSSGSSSEATLGGSTFVALASHADTKLLIKPPDHATLTPSEAAEEETHRLALYASITDRLYHSMMPLEKDVRTLRRIKGIDGDQAQW